MYHIGWRFYFDGIGGLFMGTDGVRYAIDMRYRVRCCVVDNDVLGSGDSFLRGSCLLGGRVKVIKMNEIC